MWQPLGTNRLVLKQTREIRAELHHGAVANFLPRSPQDLLRVCMRNVPQGYMCFNTQSPVGGAVWGRWQTLAGGTGIQGRSRGSKPSSASYPSSHHQLLTCKSQVLPLPWAKSTPATVLSLDSSPDVPKGEPTQDRLFSHVFNHSNGNRHLHYEPLRRGTEFVERSVYLRRHRWHLENLNPSSSQTTV